MRQVMIKGGQAVVEEIPAPQTKAGNVLVRTKISCISVGTELSGLTAQNDPLWKRAIKNPDKIAKALQLMADKGVGQTFRLIQGNQSSGIAAGYSAAGEVIDFGENINNFQPGDRVACAGAGYAMHADIISVPKNLVIPVPDNVSLKAASTVTLGAIALQGIRRLNPTLGETIIVFGLGILGQIAVKLLKANGCHVIGLDIDERRARKAEASGADLALVNRDIVPAEAISRLTNGTGADGVLVTAATSDTSLLNTAFSLCRRKGRVVLVGDVPITIDRQAIYRNELEFYISTSYGPGRYDRSFEEDGLDYPIGYVRWTETRNMSSYLDLIASGSINIDKLLDTEYDISEAQTAYKSLLSGSEKPLTILLTYNDNEKYIGRNISLKHSVASHPDTVKVAIIGAGGFARTVHIPNLKAMPEYFHLSAVCSSIGHHSKEVAHDCKAEYATTDYTAILADEKIDLVLIASRHNEHAHQTLSALKAGKNVFVEKPMALNETELAAIEDFYNNVEGHTPLVLTGFNRRFSPAILAAQKHLARRTGPMVISYRMNAGFIPHDHWTQRKEGGGRNIGEACHIYDLFTFLTKSRFSNISARSIGVENDRSSRNENFSASITFEDGSLANLIYTSLGNTAWPKEEMEIFCDGQVLKLLDYRSVEVAGEKSSIWHGQQDKGHKRELEVLGAALKEGKEWPIPLWQQLQAMRLSFQVEHQLYRPQPTTREE